MTDDLISRQAAIDALNINRNPVFHDSVDYEGAMYDICKLPSAPPSEDIKAAFEQGRIQGHVEMRTELLMQLKEIVGEEVWANI